eukprot:IDg22763t1
MVTSMARSRLTFRTAPQWCITFQSIHSLSSRSLFQRMRLLNVRVENPASYSRNTGNVPRGLAPLKSCILTQPAGTPENKNFFARTCIAVTFISNIRIHAHEMQAAGYARLCTVTNHDAQSPSAPWSKAKSKRLSDFDPSFSELYYSELLRTNAGDAPVISVLSTEAHCWACSASPKSDIASLDFAFYRPNNVPGDVFALVLQARQLAEPSI